MRNESKVILVDRIEPLIHTIRDQKVLLDSELAALYGVSTKRLNEQVRRNRKRFPDDFVFQLTAAEEACLRSQIATSNVKRGGRRYRPYVFTKHGAIMAASVLNSSRAVDVSVFVVRAFVRLRRLVLPYKKLAAKLDQLERKVAGHDDTLRQLVIAIRQLTVSDEPSPKRQRIGFRPTRD